MRRSWSLAFVRMTACSGPLVTELRVRDPWQVVPETPSGRVLLSPVARGKPWSCWNRDDDGFPHYYCGAARYELRDDGVLVVRGSAPTEEHGRVRVIVDRYRHTWCRRPLHRCTVADGRFVFATTRSNIVSLDTR